MKQKVLQQTLNISVGKVSGIMTITYNTILVYNTEATSIK